MKCKIISVVLSLLASNAMSNPLSESLDSTFQRAIALMAESQANFLHEKNNEKLKTFEKRNTIDYRSPITTGFKCGFVPQSYFNLPIKQYVFYNSVNVETWIPINGKSSSITYWQVSVSR